MWIAQNRQKRRLKSCLFCTFQFYRIGWAGDPFCALNAHRAFIYWHIARRGYIQISPRLIKAHWIRIFIKHMGRHRIGCASGFVCQWGHAKACVIKFDKNNTTRRMGGAKCATFPDFGPVPRAPWMITVEKRPGRYNCGIRCSTRQNDIGPCREGFVDLLSACQSYDMCHFFNCAGINFGRGIKRF